MFETDLQAWLTTRTAIADLVGTRIHRGIAPQGSALPRIVWQVISDIAEQDLDGATGERNARVQLRASATTPSAASTIATAIASELNPQSPDTPTPLRSPLRMGNTTILEARQAFERETGDNATDASGTTVFGKHADYLIRYRKT